MIIITTVDHHVKQGWLNRRGNVDVHESSSLNDALQLQVIKATYCETVDACFTDTGKATARLAELFTEDVRGDYGMGPLNGCNAVIAFLIDAIVATNESLWHSLHTPLIQVNGDTATGHWTVMVRSKHKGAATPDMIYGRYLDEFRRTSRGWRISAIRFIQEG
jgi:ketosteroid isomerase-like protein